MIDAIVGEALQEHRRRISKPDGPRACDLKEGVVGKHLLGRQVTFNYLPVHSGNMPEYLPCSRTEDAAVNKTKSPLITLTERQ